MIMKNGFKSFIHAMLVLLLPTALVFVSCKREDEDKQQDNAPSHVEAVDLGLSVKWASCNIGASTPEGTGAYYAWGETEVKVEYTPLTYKYYLGDLNEDGNYNNSEEYKNIGNDISGTAYDVIRTKWSGTWRMPTKEEFEELCLNCSWEDTEINGVKGKLVTGPNGNNIFLPCTGIYTGAQTSNGADGLGAYLSASIGSSQPYAYSILFMHGDIVSGDRGRDASRSDGMVIRPVKE